MSIAVKPFFSLPFTLSFALAATSLGCHAQSPVPSPGKPSSAASAERAWLSPEASRRIEVAIRNRSEVPANYEFHIESMGTSEIPGYDTITVDFNADGKKSRPTPFLISKDGKTLAQFTKFDVSKDLRTSVPGSDRPARGGSMDAPVLIVGFDDLECPFCARMNAELFPAIVERYKDQVRIVYRDFPIEQHPWALRGAVDTNCVGAQSGAGYWNLVDYIHAHADEIGGKEKTVAKANEMLDNLAREEGKKQKVNEATLSACLAKQDATAIQASAKEGEALGITATPTLFINGQKIEGAQPLQFVYRIIDEALVAAGKTPPPPPPPATEPPSKQGN